MSITSSCFGTFNGQEVPLHVLQNRSGITLKLISYGARITELCTPDRYGRTACIVTGFDRFDSYLESRDYFGCIVGRVANRIGGAAFELDGRTYTLPANNSRATLHGGPNGFDRVLWQAEQATVPSGSGIRFSYTSPDGEEGFPGTVQAQVTYALLDNDSLRIDYLATSDQATPINLSNHAYFNLQGAGSPTVLDHLLMINADAYTPTDSALVPTGEILPVAGTPLDFRKPRKVGDLIHQVPPGYDHNFVLNLESQPAAMLFEQVSGRVLEVFTTQPGIQVYSSNFLNCSLPGAVGGNYRKYSAICLETQHFPDSVHHANFPSTIVRPGEQYTHSTTWRFSCAR